MSIEIAELAQNRVEEAAALLGRAFQNDPLCICMIPNAAERARNLPLYFRAIIKSGQLIGTVDGATEQGQVNGVAVWWSLYESFSNDKMRAAGMEHNRTLITAEDYARYRRIIGDEWRVHERALPGPHWYLLQLGVEPSQQGGGVGSALLVPMLARADREHLPCFVETENPRNVPFYLKNGFELVAEAIPAEGGIRYWSFVRKRR